MGILRNSALKQVENRKRLLAAYHLYRSLIGKPAIESSVNHEKKIIFVHNPKVAGTSIRDLLGLKGNISHLTPGLLVNKRLWEEYDVVIAVREPIERFISSYNYHTSERYDGYYLKKYPDIKSWTIEKYFRIFSREPFGIIPQIHYLSHPLSFKRPDFILRYESLRSDTDLLIDALKLDNQKELPVLNESGNRVNMQQFILNKDLIRKLVDFYREDYRELDYSLPK